MARVDPVSRTATLCGSVPPSVVERTAFEATVADTVAGVILAVLGAIVSIGAGRGARLRAVHIGIESRRCRSERVGAAHRVLGHGFPRRGPAGHLQRCVSVGCLSSGSSSFSVSRGALYRISLAGSFASSVHFFWYPSLSILSLVTIVLDHVPVGGWSP